MAAVKAGDLLYVTREASVQFIHPIRFRVIRVLDWITYDGWVWLDGYEINKKGDAVARRSIFVMKAGLRSAPAPVTGGQSGRTRVPSLSRIDGPPRMLSLGVWVASEPAENASDR
ncbi:hypothetical protein O7614_27380 [Micromonospora sp. WMMD961]|uniref:hypothetical protein n=1 Tax=Micromonospora sp. WMMD961 TaxID=3016100 RepID=UPI002417C989|nr:hypothetical protein [Micromonospora sp. WMMD961]MDG4783382.1 hypothetical protein [Micromonospora sp. WMMD961]